MVVSRSVPAAGAKVRRVAVLDGLPAASSHWPLLRDRLGELGWREGWTVAVTRRSAGGHLGRLPALAREVVDLGVDVIVTGGTSASMVARDATERVPIVFVAVADPVGTGLVTSLARPGGNITGVSLFGPALVERQLAVLREAVPRGTRVTVLWNPAHASHGRLLLGEADSAARGLGLSLRFIGVRSPEELAPVLRSIDAATADALLVLDDLLFLLHRRRIAELTAASGLPVMHGAVEHVEAGGLMALVPTAEEQWQRAALLVDRILRGTAPGELAVEQPTRFSLVINLGTARALGLTLPPALLRRADRVIE